MDWIKALDEVTDLDLQKINDRLSQIEREVTALRAVKRIFEAKLGIKVEPSPSHKAKVPVQEKPLSVSGQPRGGIFSGYREKAARYLVHAGTPCKPSVVAAACEIPIGSTQAVFDHSWFVRKPEGIVLSPEGRSSVTKSA